MVFSGKKGPAWCLLLALATAYLWRGTAARIPLQELLRPETPTDQPLPDEQFAPSDGALPYVERARRPPVCTLHHARTHTTARHMPRRNAVD
jgi:hypothetical protein